VERTVTLTATAPPPPPPPPAPVIDLFEVRPASVQAGVPATLEWRTSNASAVTLDGATVAAAGTKTVSHAAAGSVPYKLIAKNAAGLSAEKTVTLTVTAAPPPPPPPPPPTDVPAWVDHFSVGVPNKAASPDVQSVRSGSWSEASMWYPRPPRAGDAVLVGSGHTITVDVVSDEPLHTAYVHHNGGKLRFPPDKNSRLTVRYLIVPAGGALEAGTPAAPVRADVRAEIVFPDVPIDTDFDASQMGNGLIGFGTVTMHGAAKTSWVRLAKEPKAGDTTLTLAAPVSGWRPSDKLILGDSRCMDEFERQGGPDRPEPRVDLPAVASVSADGKTVTLTGPLAHDHPGARDPDGTLKFVPHVGNMTRNVVVRSANARGVRGHTIFAGRADLDLRHAQFAALGRTTVDDEDPTKWDQDADGNWYVSHVGTNEPWRHPLTLFRLIGPEGRAAGTPQYRVEDCVVSCPLRPMKFKWGMTVFDSHHGLIKGNVLYNWAGSSVAFTGGNETENVIEGNFVVLVDGDGRRNRDGRDGFGIWTRGPNNRVRDNVVCTVRAWQGFLSWGFAVNNDTIASWAHRVPAYKGADPQVEGQYRELWMVEVPLLEFARNEAYGGNNAFGLWWLGIYGWEPVLHYPGSVIKDCKSWNNTLLGFYLYENNGLTIDGFVGRGDWSQPGGQRGGGTGQDDYKQRGLRIVNCDIRGYDTGIEAPYHSDGETLIENCTFQNAADVSVGTPFTIYGGTPCLPKSTVLRNCRHLPWAERYADLYLFNQGYGSENAVVANDVFVYAHNGNAADNFRVWFDGQKADAIVPMSEHNESGTLSLVGAPEPGLTNAQCWARYGLAVWGSVAPANATTRPGVHGLVGPVA
jgi:hypothetical protein